MKPKHASWSIHIAVTPIYTPKCHGIVKNMSVMLTGLWLYLVVCDTDLGGGSALLSLPVPPLTLQDLITTTKSLAKAGADIVELNTVRKHLEILKGGGLARIAYPAQVWFISD